MSLSYPNFFLYTSMVLHSFSIHLCNALDCLTDGSMITDGTGTTLVSPGELFELGFFTPDGSFDSNNRYMGIWYYNSNPRIVVWVANNKKPLVSNGYLVVKDGKAEVLDTDGSIYWTTSSDAAVNSTELCLSHEGNLILSGHQGRVVVLWQSFDHPTDTFLSGMTFNGSLTLTSWLNPNNPAPGNTQFHLERGKDPKMAITGWGSSPYWDSKDDPSDNIRLALTEFLVSEDERISLPNNTRLVMNVTGQIQLWKLGNDRSWSLDWVEPKDRCSYNTKCGNFGSCNSNSALPCKCLPGFKPSLSEEWKAGCFTGGCVPDSGTPCQRISSCEDTFLRLPMMKVGGSDCSGTNAENCKALCISDCTCVAYAYGVANCTGLGDPNKKRCLTWTHLPQLQEEYSQGLTLFVRAPSSDIEVSSRDCKPCGAYAIPYPLSTYGANCGDPSYSNLHCNPDTGQVNFSTPAGTFRVNLIDTDAKLISIQVMNANSCDTEYTDLFVLPLKSSLRFVVKNCSLIKDDPLIQLAQPFIEVNIGWQPPPEPTCNGFSDCLSWPHTSCKAVKGGKRRCVCRSNYHWNGSKLTCIPVAFRIKIVVPCIAAVMAMILLSSVFFIYLKRRRRIAQKQCSVKFKDDTEGLDVPIFGWGSILAATTLFAEANKLGTGGFGSVYRGKLPDGKEIAVKRLSNSSTQGVAEFTTEVVLIAKLQHRNLVRLLGYCVKSQEKILVYEYMPNGSLDSFLFDRTLSVKLDWEKRFDIIFGIARGIVYLHRDSRLRIIHRDLKPSNILLDEELNPKISDFGLARIVGGKETEANTSKVVGTYGYMSPEYACEGFFSIKSDVFSFGVIVLETLSGRRNTRTAVFEHGLSLLGHAWRLWTEDGGLEFMDPTLKESCNQIEALTCMHVGLLCVQDDPADRPTMSTVVLLLSNESTTVSGSLLKKPAYFTRATSSESPSTTSIGGSSSFNNCGQINGAVDCMSSVS